MYLGSQLDSLYDEKSWGSDSYSSSSSLFKVQQNWTSYGNFSSSDYKDYYQFSSGVGDFTLYVTGDSTNGFATSTPNYLFAIKMLDSSGKDIGIAASSYDTSTKSISYTAPSDQTYYLEIDNTIGSSFSYAATLQPSYSASPAATASLDGTNGNDYLVGTNGEDDLMGGFGTDTLVGGLGDDTYFVNANSNIVENSNGGTDEVFTNSSGVLAESLTSFGLPANVENVFDFGSGSFLCAGNELNNAMIAMGTGVVNFFGYGGDDILNGGIGNDGLWGGEGDDYLDGKLGGDAAGFYGNKSDYTVSKSGGNYVISSVAEGRDILTNIENVYFLKDDVVYAIDSLLEKTNSAPIGSSVASFPAINEDDGYYRLKDADYYQGFSDSDGDSLQAINIKAINGILTKNAAGDWILTPNANYNGTVQLTYDVIDNKGGTVPAKMSFVINSVNDAPTGSVFISGTTTQGQVLTVSNSLADVDGLGVISNQWLSNSVAIYGANQTTYILTAADVGKSISVKASYTDLQHTTENVTSGATALIASPTNYSPTGNVTITGTAQQNQTLTVSNNLVDANGLGAINYSWLSNGAVISNQISYALTQTDVGKAISVTASYIDGLGKLESVTSSSVTVSNVNDLPTGSVSISGTTTQGQVLTATNSLADVDGLGVISNQWLSNGAIISGANQTTYTLTANDVGKTISVKASYTDLQNTVENVTSGATELIIGSQSAPTGNVAITGSAIQGQTLAIDNTLADANGLGVFMYQWMRGANVGDAITGASQSTYTLTADDVGKNISVIVGYVDGLGKQEGLLSNETTLVAPPANYPHAGSLSINGNAIQDKTLSIENSLSDEDGLGAFNYQWLSNDLAISGATQTAYTLTQTDVGKSISVTTSYTDGLGKLESATSSGVIISNVNDLPTGSVLISGEAQQGKILTASNSLADADGLGVISNQWLSNGTLISGANQITYTLTANDVGKTISVKASYTDLQNTVENVTSGTTDLIKAIPPFYNLTVNKIAIGEGATVWFNLTTTNLLKGAVVAFKFGGEISNDDISGGLPVGQFVVGATGKASLNVKFLKDKLTEGNETLTLTLVDDSTQTVSMTVNDTSLTVSKKITGTAKNDTLLGFDGNDTLVGGLGADTLKGGKGADIFKFNKMSETGVDVATCDIIVDFKTTDNDKIDLSGIDANSQLAKDQAFTFIGSEVFNNADASGQLRFDATSHILYGSVNADDTPEFSIQLNGVTSLVASDFVL